jgi:hypothetical protein
MAASWDAATYCTLQIPTDVLEELTAFTIRVISSGVLHALSEVIFWK